MLEINSELCLEFDEDVIADCVFENWNFSDKVNESIELDYFDLAGEVAERISFPVEICDLEELKSEIEDLRSYHVNTINQLDEVLSIALAKIKELEKPWYAKLQELFKTFSS